MSVPMQFRNMLDSENERYFSDKIYSNLQDAKKHFLAWVRTNNNHILSKVEKNKPNIAKGNSYTD